MIYRIDSFSVQSKICITVISLLTSDQVVCRNKLDFNVKILCKHKYAPSTETQLHFIISQTRSLKAFYREKVPMMNGACLAFFSETTKVPNPK